MGQKKVLWCVNLVDWHFINNDFSMKSWSKLKTDESFTIYMSWGFWNTPYMFDLGDNSLRFLRLKYNQIFTSDFFQRLSSSVPNMTSNDNLKVSILSLVTPSQSHITRFTILCIILIWQALFSCPTWFGLYCTCSKHYSLIL